MSTPPMVLKLTALYTRCSHMRCTTAVDGGLRVLQVGVELVWGSEADVGGGGLTVTLVGLPGFD